MNSFTYRALVDGYKQQHEAFAAANRVQMSDAQMWQSIRQMTDFAARMVGMIRQTSTESDPAVHSELQQMIVMVRQDMLGITASGVQMHREDAVDAGPERRLAAVLESADNDEQVSGLQLAYANSLYKLLKWESYTQLQQLLNALESADLTHRTYLHESLGQMQLVAGPMQAALENDLESKPHMGLIPPYPGIMKQFQRLEALELPPVKMG